MIKLVMLVFGLGP